MRSGEILGPLDPKRENLRQDLMDLRSQVDMADSQSAVEAADEGGKGS
jgi:hypothetical protein